ncbi:hypothetical protein C0J52_28155, partial [Blattella germanica]
VYLLLFESEVYKRYLEYGKGTLVVRLGSVSTRVSAGAGVAQTIVFCFCSSTDGGRESCCPPGTKGVGRMRSQERIKSCNRTREEVTRAWRAFTTCGGRHNTFLRGTTHPEGSRSKFYMSICLRKDE